MTMRQLLAALLAFSTAMAQTTPTKSEIDDARNSNKAFTDAMVKFRTAVDWTPLVDELENTAKHYVGKSKIQIAMLDRQFPDAPPEFKAKASLMALKLDEAAAQAIRFSDAYRKAMSSLGQKGTEHIVAYATEAETERIKFNSAAKEWALAARDFTKK